MAKFNKVQVITAMRETGMVPVFYNSDPEVVKNVVKACYDGGVRVFALPWSSTRTIPTSIAGRVSTTIGARSTAAMELRLRATRIR